VGEGGRRTLEEHWAAAAHATSQFAVEAADEIRHPPPSRSSAREVGSIAICGVVRERLYGADRNSSSASRSRSASAAKPVTCRKSIAERVA